MANTGICVCPPPAAITEIPAKICGVKFDQIVKIAFQRVDSPGALPVFDGSGGNDITVLGDWNTRIAADDSSRIIVTPLFDSLVLPVSESIVEGGGDNTTIFGLPNYQGEDNVSVDAIRLKNLNTAIKAAFDDLTCESDAQSGIAKIWMYFFNRFKKIINISNGSLFEGIPVFNIRLSSLGSEGLNADNISMLKFDLVNSPTNWDLNSQITDPAFNPLVL